MTPTAGRTTLVPIYDSLVQEHGDVPARARQVAREVEREARHLLDWSELHPIEAEEREKSREGAARKEKPQKAEKTGADGDSGRGDAKDRPAVFHSFRRPG
ncbi:hypothetical protein [Streptomyces sp. MST-110588]|uniref:hypothetical protein n=1 Tax=Streptomyces sp. MST-110588 TaxID=2833628 RepID=UPI001F5DB3AD|nr:hypothetical protein [Streptomyces sp. MST-110588]UNO44444.1 hypothetical protein KGS77_33510 [Streptomyces sp. MST-110588]